MSALEDDYTVFQPAGTTASGAAPAPSQPAERASGGLAAGTLLNNIYEVRRFLARGGMGEVYEGVNVNTDERVAIKVMLPHLAADPKVQAMFRKEARILTELAHPALVRYRVLAHEPQLGLFYIVTEFIDGRSLSDLIGKSKPTAAQLAALIRRLAEGLAAAHALGAVHRDMSPDNVLLPEGRLDLAKIIDFGIARESNFAHQTVIGDGFAGKLGYVAPEQLGDFGRRIGPWTDVYSLGLVGLAFASGRDPDLGSTLVDAVDRRRDGVDLTSVPPLLSPIFAGMLAPDPTQRFQSMGEVLAALDDLAPGVAPARREPAAAPAEGPGAEAGGQASKTPWLLGAGALGLLLIVGIGLAVSAGGKKQPDPSVASTETLPAVDAAHAVPLQEPSAPAVAEPPPQAAPAAPVAAKPSSRGTRANAHAPEIRVAPVEPLQGPATLTPPAALSAAPDAEPSPARASAAPAAEKSVQACWRAAGEGWAYLGYASRSSCVAQVFTSCEVIHGRWGKDPLRRYDGKLQAKSGGLINRWQTVGASSCPAEPTAAP